MIFIPNSLKLPKFNNNLTKKNWYFDEKIDLVYKDHPFMMNVNCPKTM